MNITLAIGIIITMVLPQAVIAFDSRHIVRRTREFPVHAVAWRTMHRSLCAALVAGTAVALATITPLAVVAAGTSVAAALAFAQYQSTRIYLRRLNLA